MLTKSTKGMTIQQMVGPFLELHFDFQKLPALDLEREFFVIEAVPKTANLATERIKINSSGPLFLVLQEGVKYQINLLRSSKLKYEVHSNLESLPHIHLIEEHPQLFRLIWGNIDLESIQDEFGTQELQIKVDGNLIVTKNLFALPEEFIAARPKTIQLQTPNGVELASIQTNLQEEAEVCTLGFQMPKAELKMHAFSATHTGKSWKIRAEVTPFFQMQKGLNALVKEVAASQGCHMKHPVIGFKLIAKANHHTTLTRQFAWSAKVDQGIIAKIQTEELGFTKTKKPAALLAQIQITTAHRELHKEVLFQKEIKTTGNNQILQFSQKEMEQAKAELFTKNPLAQWDTSYIELVFCFAKAEENNVGDRWQEFQREIAHNLRWEFWPNEEECEQGVEASLVVYDLEDPDTQYPLLSYGTIYPDPWPVKVALKPYSSHSLLAWWDLAAKDVSQLLQETWHKDFTEVGFYLKVHEEYLGNRSPRPDLDAQITDLFSDHQNLYFKVDPDRQYSAEIVARCQEKELALTPISKPIISPKGEGMFPSEKPPYEQFTHNWAHPSQREVLSLKGKDSDNQSKVILHLHMHSPNLFRAEQFRESFLKKQPWPIRTKWGDEVHNTPGEWAYKNCLDSWLPILMSLEKLKEEGVDFQVSMDITPPVAYMISHPRFKDYFSRFLERCISHTAAQIALMKAKLENPEFIWAAQKHLEWIQGIDLYYNNHLQKDIVGAYRRLEESGHLELSTCTATHGMLANLESTPKALKRQIKVAGLAHQRIFGTYPKGIWPAENSCFPGLGGDLAEAGYQYYFIEAEAALQGEKALFAEEFNPIINPTMNPLRSPSYNEEEQIVSFPRNRMGRVQVWDAEIGYAGHPDFREYHYRHYGLPLKRITSKTSEEKKAYNPDKAKQTAQSLAQDFFSQLCKKSQEIQHLENSATPLLTCSYDAELFGHHWFEGPWFLEELLREFHRKSNQIGLTTAAHYLATKPTLPVSMPNPSTWGHEASHVRWNDPKVSWAQKALERAECLLEHYETLQEELAPHHQELLGMMRKELIRAESSDLTFVIMSGDFEEDMQREILKYLDYFYRLKSLIDNKLEDKAFLLFRRYENDMFPEM